MDWHRFSAFWLRSKCSICSYQLNIWYDPHWGSTILNWFLNQGEDTGACSDFPTGWPGIAVPPGSAHSPMGEIHLKNNERKMTHSDSHAPEHLTVFSFGSLFFIGVICFSITHFVNVQECTGLYTQHFRSLWNSLQLPKTQNTHFFELPFCLFWLPKG